MEPEYTCIFEFSRRPVKPASLSSTGEDTAVRSKTRSEGGTGERSSHPDERHRGRARASQKQTDGPDKDRILREPCHQYGKSEAKASGRVSKYLPEVLGRGEQSSEGPSEAFDCSSPGSGHQTGPWPPARAEPSCRPPPACSPSRSRFPPTRRTFPFRLGAGDGLDRGERAVVGLDRGQRDVWQCWHHIYEDLGGEDGHAASGEASPAHASRTCA